ncbi:MAG: hypothetical protein KDB27_03080, partial [Planctomycetales bacterium]|nr:hypothetical protein [Planctomycetales bacterium]
MSLSSKYQWKTCPEPAQHLYSTLDRLLDGTDFGRRWSDRCRPESGTRFFDWVDHIVVHDDQHDTLANLGFELTDGTWRNPDALFPSVRFGEKHAVAIKVDSAIDFAAANGLANDCTVTGSDGDQFMSITVNGNTDFVAIERHGYRGYSAVDSNAAQKQIARDFYASISQRHRDHSQKDPASGFDEAAKMLKEVSTELDINWACDIFFRAEREYWMSRNKAARVQKKRQDALGSGWANHDHHTFRSSRECFARLVSVLELMGFECREQFYAGEQAGWGAQVLEHPKCGIVIFTDV